ATLPSPALAGGNELQLTVGPGYASIPDISEGLDGVGATVDLTYRFDEFWAVSLGGHFSHHFGEVVPGEEEDDPPEVFEDTNIATVWIGPRFSLDYFVLVPYVSIAPELIVTSGELLEDQEETDFGLRFSVGFDYRPERHYSVGFEANYHSFLREPLVYPVLITTTFRFSYHYQFGLL
ncbi:MAG: outer membrane beta-barrel protein, partial [Myxococcales bacterium]|nr:outer membrane beta-barrel protein [Myxococcales bacterium]